MTSCEFGQREAKLLTAEAMAATPARIEAS
jgi:hypothetical protein